MRWAIYNVVFTIGYLLMMPKFLFRMWKRGGYRKGFLQRLGWYEPDVLAALAARSRIWIHAVSVGELFVALRFMEEIRRVRPGVSFVLTTTTSTGHKLAEQKLAAGDVLLYFPSDFPSVVRKVLSLVKPQVIFLTESEFWPNLIRTAKERGIPVALINGRVSDSSFRGYQLVRTFVSRILSVMDLLLVQSDADRDRLVALGALPERVKVVGTAKFDIAQDDPVGQEAARRVLEAVGVAAGDPVILGGSTWAGEEAALMGVYKKLRSAFPGLFLVLVPRHAERRGEVEREIAAQGLRHVRRSAMAAGQPMNEGRPDVLLVDTTGELKNLYVGASVIFVGKSLCARGGQNIIEPAMLARPVVVGPHMGNFEAVMADFLKAGAMLQVPDEAALEGSIRRLLEDTAFREDLGRRAREVCLAGRGSVVKSVGLLLPLTRAGGT